MHIIRLSQKVHSFLRSADPIPAISRDLILPIHNYEELEARTEILFRLTALEDPSPHQEEAIERLTLLITRYEEEQYPD